MSSHQEAHNFALRIASPDMRQRAASATIEAPIECVIGEWADAPEWGELRKATRLTFGYGGSAPESYVAIHRSPDQSVIYLDAEEMVRVANALTAALAAIREWDAQRYFCNVGECAHPEHRRGPDQ